MTSSTPRTRFISLIVSLTVGVLSLVSPASGDLIAYWNFNDDTDLTTLLTVSQGAGTLTHTFVPANVTDFTGSAINAQGGDPAGQALALQGGTGQINNGEFLIVAVDTTGFQNIVMSLATQRTATGFNSNQVAYSSDGGANWTDFGAAYDPPAAFALSSFDFSSVSALNNNPAAMLRIQFDGSTSSSGNNRIDNLLIEGDLPVHNVTQDTYHATIQAAIDAAIPGDLIEAAAGTYNESPIINKSLTLQGAGCGMSEIVLSGANYLSAIEITGAGTNATIRDFTITGYDAVGPGLASTNFVVYQPTGDTLIEDCCLKIGKRGPGTNGDDGFGILTVYFDAAVVIDSVTVTGCSLEPVSDGGRGFFINPGVGVFSFTDNTMSGLGNGSSFTQAADGLIEGNTITGTGAAGSRIGGVGAWGYPDPSMWGRTTFRRNTISNAFAGARLLSVEDSVVEENAISDCDYGVSVADFSQAFDATTNTIFNNSFESIEFLSVDNTEAVVVNASGNWFGSNAASSVSTAVSALTVDYTPWLDVGTDTDLGAAGFQGDFATLWVDDDSPQSGLVGRIQEGVNLVTASIVNVLPGTYEEQVVINTDNLQLIGGGSGTNPVVDTIIQSPTSLAYSFVSPGPSTNRPIVGVHDCEDVSIENLRVDGLGRGNANARFIGIAFWNAGGEVLDVAVTGTRNSPLDGSQHGVGVYAFNDTGGPYTLDVENADISDYQKNGMVLAGAGLTISVDNCTVTGSGPLGSGLPAQNGIQVSSGAVGSITNCTVSNHQYTPASFASTGVLIFGTGTVDVIDCDMFENLPGIYVQDAGAMIDGCLIENSGAPGTGDGIIVLNTTPLFLRSGDNSGDTLKRPLLEVSPFGMGSNRPTFVGMATSPRSPRSISVSIADSMLVGGGISGMYGIFAYSTSSVLSMDVTGCTIKDWEYGVVAFEAGGAVESTVNNNCIVDNLVQGFYATGPTVQDATYNFWGDDSGPLDTIGTDEAGNPPCFDPSTMVNADGAGNGASEFVNYCPWLGGKGTLSLEVNGTCPDDAHAAAGYQIEVQVWMRNLLQDVTGFQAFIAFDSTKLSYRGDLSSYTNMPFSLHIQSIGTAEVAAGELRLDGSVGFMEGGTSADALLATLIFDVTLDCSMTAIEFDTGPLPSELSFEGDPVLTGTINTPALTLDDEPPVLSDPGDPIFECDGSGNTAEIAAWLASVTANDDCDGSLLVSHDYAGLSDDCGETGSATVTFTAMDACGNTAELVRTVTVADTTPPMFTTDPGDGTFECDGSGNTADIAAWLASAAASDACGSVNLTHDYVGLSDDCGATGSATVTFTAEDECGLTTQVVRTVTVADTTPPMFTTDPGDGTFECDGSGNTADIAAWLAIAAASDACGSVNLTHDYVGLSDDCGATGSATVTFTAEDECGLTTQVVRTVTVVDTTPPVFMPDPGNASFECDGAGNAAEIAAWLASAAAVDDCGSANVTHDYTGLSDDCGATGSAIVTFTAEDECGLTTQVVRTVSVVDTTPPSITCPADINVNADPGSCFAVVDPGMASASDDCGSVIITGVRDDMLSLSDPYPAGVTLITWSAEDECGLMSAPCVQTITVDSVNEVMVTVVLDNVFHQGALAGQTPLSFTRNIRFIAKNGMSCAAPVCVPVTFTGTPGDEATATVTFDVDCGDWTSICAKDPQHTLISEVGLTISGLIYEGAAPIVLLSGDTDNDSDVDINDVTYFLFRFGTASPIAAGPCPYSGVRDADFSINGAVGIEDYTFLTANWLQFSSCPCSVFLTDPDRFAGDVNAAVMDGFGMPAGPSARTRLFVHEFDAEFARAVDLNADGVVDYRDVRLFEQQNGLPNTLSSLVETSDRASPADPVSPAGGGVGGR